jgi:hypothetical protein
VTITSKKKSHFKLKTDWIISEPIDYEHKFYLLMDFIKHCDEKIDKFELYPLMTEISLHLANIQSIGNELKYITVDKKFKNSDDEILLSELKFNDIPNLSDSEFKEFNKIIELASSKLLQYFNIIKAVWNLVYETISIKVDENNFDLDYDNGFFYSIKNQHVNLWKYSVKQTKTNLLESHMDIKHIYEGDRGDLELYVDNSKPVFELTYTNDFNMKTTLLPIFKRKVLSYLIQSRKIVSMKNIN